ncbi:MAG: trypsin-like peptidase domain-containing protein [Planctomycetota bacterium]
MRDRIRWVLFEATKLAVVLALFSVIHSRVADANYEAFAGAHRIDQFASESIARMVQLERAGELSLEQIEAARLELDRMEIDLERANARFASHQASLNEILELETTELESALRKDLERVEGSASKQVLQFSERVTDLETRIRREPDDLKRRMIYPVIQLRGNGTVGSGVIISSERESQGGKAITYVLTAFHVVQEITDGLDDPTRIGEVKFVNPEDDRLLPIAGGARVVAFQPDIDIAMLRMELDEPWPYVATLVSPEEARNVEIFDPVYAVGCPLGNKPLPTVGEISSQEKIVAGETFWMVNAPTFFGNSGGGVFLSDSGELIGISSMIYTYGKTTPMVVPHMGLFVPLETVRDWLRKEGYATLFTDEAAQIRNASSSTPK